MYKSEKLYVKYSLIDELKLKRLSEDHGISKSAMIRQLITKAYYKGLYKDDLNSVEK